MAARPWRVAETSLMAWQRQPPEVVVLPFGAVEPHGLHLPYATDVLEVEALADRACELAYGRGARVALLPAIPFGVQTSQQAFPLAMNLYPSTLFRMLSDLAESLDNSRVRKAVIFNGHGGNDFYTWLKESYGKHKAFFVQVHWFHMCGDLAKELFAAGGDHANDMETSLMLHLRPDLVDLNKASPQQVAAPRLAAMREGWARAPRPWELYTADSGAGDPRAATADKGRQYFDAVAACFADFLVELAEAELDDHFPFIRAANKP
jgi:creatinine amidohydrolase